MTTTAENNSTVMAAAMEKLSITPVDQIRKLSRWSEMQDESVMQSLPSFNAIVDLWVLVNVTYGIDNVQDIIEHINDECLGSKESAQTPADQMNEYFTNLVKPYSDFLAKHGLDWDTPDLEDMEMYFHQNTRRGQC